MAVFLLDLPDGPTYLSMLDHNHAFLSNIDRQADGACGSLLDLLAGSRGLPEAASEQEISTLRQKSRRDLLFLSEGTRDEGAGLEVSKQITKSLTLSLALKHIC